MTSTDAATGRFGQFCNPATGEWIEFTRTAQDGDDDVVRFNWRSMPGGAVLGRGPVDFVVVQVSLGSDTYGMSSGVVVRLLGRPQVERDGVCVAAPRGRKCWAVLAYLALAELPVTRERLASLLFAGADDPLGAVRWTLAELRRALGAPDAFRGDPAARGDMRELLVRAAMARLGDPSALDAVRLGEAIDNPALRGDLAIA